MAEGEELIQFGRYFTVAEANELIPQLRDWFGELHTLDARLRDIHDEVQEILDRRVAFNVGGSEVSRYFVLSTRARSVIDEILSTGVHVKDLERGLCDFPHRVAPGGEQVFLCWELTETEITHWHSLDAGYAGRRPLSDLGAGSAAGG